MNNLNTIDLTNKSKNFNEIFEENKNIAIWERKLNHDLFYSSKHVLTKNPNLEFSKIVDKESLKERLYSEFCSDTEASFFIKDVCDLVNEFCKMFNTQKAWLRLDSINRPMCPNFHTDDVKCRMVSTYVGPATQWIPQDINENNLKESDIRQLDTGHVALLKGEGWKGNEGNGLIHRSPHQKTKYKRLYMTIDFVDFYYCIYQNRIYQDN